MASLAMNVIKWCVPTVMPTMRYTARFRASIVGRAYPTPASATRWVRSRCNIQQGTILGHPVYTIAPKVGGSRWHILYAHGGSYVRPLRKVHWGIVRGLIQATRATVTLPIYPLSPEHDHEPAHALVKAVYRRIASAIPPENIVMSGDNLRGTDLVSVARWPEQPIKHRDVFQSCSAQLCCAHKPTGRQGFPWRP